MNEPGSTCAPANVANVIDPLLVRRLRLASLACALTVVVLGCAVFLGWVSGVRWFEAAAARPAIQPLTALSLVLGGSAVLLLRAPGRARGLGRVLGALLLFLGLATLIEYVVDADIGLDQLLLRTAVSAEVLYPGRLAPHTAIALVLLGAGLLGSAPHGPTVLRDVLAALAGLVALTATIGFAYGVPALYHLDAPVGMAVYTAVGIVLLACAILLTDPERGLLRVVVHRTVGGVLARRLLPIATIVPLVLGFGFFIVGEWLGWFGVALGAALLVVAAIVILTAFVLHTAAVLDRTDVARLGTEDTLCDERSRLAAIFDHAASGIVYIDARDRRETANPAAEALVGATLTGRSLDEAALEVKVHDVNGRPIPREQRPSRRALLGEAVAPAEMIVTRPDGQRRPILVSATPVRGAREEVVGAVFVLEDLSTQKELDRLRAEFAAIVAHDLRNPISAILMNAELVLERAAGRAEAAVPVHHIERIRRSAARLGALVAEMLDASRIDLGRLSLDPRSVDIAEVVNDLLPRLVPVIGDRRVEIAVEGVAPRAFVDVLRLGEIVTNLIENAARFSPVEAPIHVAVRAARGGVELAVTDEGRGMSPDEIDLLFDRAYQARHSRETRGGLGLGLYIAKGLVDAHGGQIRVESALGHGSTFYVWLPPAGPVAPRPAHGEARAVRCGIAVVR
ncbi:MAG TPA: PAS domain-containing sensor histidine kinase [Kofleriaceae bacterium]|nr:PAS domain-containing sensor histidine kinase [Kofleriaceae bacterium]